MIYCYVNTYIPIKCTGILFVGIQLLLIPFSVLVHSLELLPVMEANRLAAFGKEPPIQCAVSNICRALVAQDMRRLLVKVKILLSPSTSTTLCI